MEAGPAASTSTSAPASGPSQSNGGITEDEAALYDRQIRLWGVEAQNRMRSASVLVVTLRGLAAEVCKNIVLAGIGKLTILDDKDVSEEDLGANFFLREEEIGQKRVSAAKARINALNPRVEVVASTRMEDLHDEAALQAYDLIVLTDSDRDTIIRVNDLCRKLGKKFYACGSYGLNGYIFADLLEHEWIIETTDKPATDKKAKNGAPASTEAVKVTVKKNQSFVPLTKALQHSFESISVKKQKKMNAMLWATLVLWEYQARYEGALPVSDSVLAELQTIAKEILPKHGAADASLLPNEALESLSVTATMEFTPVCAILGGVMGQDALNTLGGREPPVINLFAYDGSTGAGDFYQMGLP